MKRLAIAAGGFVLGYAYALLSMLVSSKRLGSLRKQPPHPDGTCADDCPWTEHPDLDGDDMHDVSGAGVPFGPISPPVHPLDGDDMHDVLPTDDEIPPHQHEKWQIREDIPGRPYCAACGDRIVGDYEEPGRFTVCSECHRSVPLPWRVGYLSRAANFMADLCSTCGYPLSS